MSADDQLIYEARVRNRQAAIALLAGLLVLVGSIVQLSGRTRRSTSSRSICSPRTSDSRST
jgi:hypothetical protein